MRFQYSPATILTSRRRTTEQHFWDKVDKASDCWLWTAGAYADGYGRFFGSDWTGNKANMRAIEYSWWIHFGRHPFDSNVDVSCGNRRCVRPEHLRLA